MPVGKPGLRTGIGYSRCAPVFGIEFAEKILDEIRIPDIALRVGAHVMRRNCFSRQVVFGDDDVGGAALRPRQRPQFVSPSRSRAQIDRRQIGGELAHRSRH